MNMENDFPFLSINHHYIGQKLVNEPFELPIPTPLA
jgi:hypothetical protein